ncbi:hypothetical protein COF04_31250 [Bacillus toyonensis]|nr:hypothetical protein AT265_09745 [Bacillus cereus]PEF81331.1 hypothetical protein CON80_09505 [Bacillus toyonensis]PFY17017.1 hypothetical protein COL44_29900 [Bacillus toyonensis]PHB90782.1 hypothetical protein COF04_31250 [Bacillus toyonensis]PHE30802.1 hypothetical protein COF73_12030 [Bacillus toyonensis]
MFLKVKKWTKFSWTLMKRQKLSFWGTIKFWLDGHVTVPLVKLKKSWFWTNFSPWRVCPFLICLHALLFKFLVPKLFILFVGFSVFLSNISLKQGGTIHDY